MAVRKASSRKEAEKLALLHHAIICIGIDDHRIPIHLVVNRNDFELAQKVNELQRALKRFKYRREEFINPIHGRRVNHYTFLDEDDRRSGEFLIRHIQSLTDALYKRAFFAYWED